MNFGALSKSQEKEKNQEVFYAEFMEIINCLSLLAPYKLQYKPGKQITFIYATLALISWKKWTAR